MKSPKTSRQTKSAQPRSFHAAVGRKALVHAIANCLNCDWEAQDYRTTQKQARRHVQTTGHAVSMDLGYAVTISPNDHALRPARGQPEGHQ